MTSAAVESFERTVGDLPVTLERTTVAAFDETLARHLERPAVGVPLSIDGLSLEDHPVTVGPTPTELETAAVGVTPVAPAIAEYGTVVVPSDAAGAEQISLYPETHVAVLPASAVVETIAEAIDDLAGEIEGGLTSAVLTTGPSVTADMGAPVYGAHGPENLTVLLVEDR